MPLHKFTVSSPTILPLHEAPLEFLPLLGTRSTTPLLQASSISSIGEPTGSPFHESTFKTKKHVNILF